MDKIQECAQRFKKLADTTKYTFHTSLNRKISVFDIDFTDAYLSKDSNYKGRPNQERDVELRISEFRYLEEYLDEDNIVYIYSPKDSPKNNSLIPCDYIIKSYSEVRNQTVFIFLVHREGIESPCRIISFGVKKNVEYGGIYQYVMLKDKTINNVRSNLYIHPRYTKEQILLAEPSINADYMKIMNTNI